jgi:hypothetical protein
MRQPHAYCEKCGALYGGHYFSNERCPRQSNGKRCTGVLAGILEGDLKSCPTCQARPDAKCEACNGWGVVHDPKR